MISQPPIPSHVLPGLVLLQESILSGVDGCILPPVQFPVLAHRADLDAYPAGRDAPLVQFGAVGGAALLVCEPLRIVFLVQACAGHILTQRMQRVHSSSCDERIGWELCCCKNRAETHAGAKLGREQHIVCPEIAQARQQGSVPVGEESHRIFQQGLDAEVSVPGNEDGRVAFFIQKIGQAVGVLVQQAFTVLYSSR